MKKVENLRNCTLTTPEALAVMYKIGRPVQARERVKMFAIIRLNIDAGALYVPHSWAYKNQCLVVTSPSSGVVLHPDGALGDTVNLTSLYTDDHMCDVLKSKETGAFNILLDGTSCYDFSIRDCW